MTDIPLTENGRSVAKLLKPVLTKETFALVLTGPLQRARETCELAGLGGCAEVDRDPMEWNYGECEGLTPQQIHANNPGWEVTGNVLQAIFRALFGQGVCLEGMLLKPKGISNLPTCAGSTTTTISPSTATPP